MQKLQPFTSFLASATLPYSLKSWFSTLDIPWWVLNQFDVKRSCQSWPAGIEPLRLYTMVFHELSQPGHVRSIMPAAWKAALKAALLAELTS